MSLGRIVGGLTAALAVAGCATVAIGMSRTGTATSAGPSAAFTMPGTHPARATFAALPTTTASSAAAPTTSAPATHATVRPRTSAARPVVAPPARPRATTAARPVVHPPAAAAPRPHPTSRAAPAPRPAAVPRGVSLPLRYSTGNATKVITVTASSRSRTVATLQAWTKVSGGGWRRYGTATTAHIGADGMSTHPSESTSATPMGSFTLTQAFGYYGDPGTPLPYFRTLASDWWISQAGPLYNTHQRCSSGCRFRQGDPNEHLRYETPYYNYAVVIDYNTRNAPGGVRQGAGSAFFLHVYPAGTGPTAGCVAIGQSKLVSLMRWLNPGAHPRILIGVH